MTTNLMDDYIKITKNFLKDFTKAFFAEKYKEAISNEYIEAYIETRIYNFGGEEHRFFYRRIYTNLIKKSKEIKENSPILDGQLIEDNLKMYQYVFYFDGVRGIQEPKAFIKEMCEKRTTKFGLIKITGLEDRIYKMAKKYNEDKEKFIKNLDTQDFTLKIEKYTLIDDTYKSDLDFNFNLPYIYSKKVINEVYNDGVINEDKLIIEYNLLVGVCINDINKCNFDTKYLVNFANTLFEKEKKLRQTLRIIDNTAIQDKIILKIKYQDFEKNKEIIYSLMKEGFKFALILDDNFETTMDNIRKLDMFQYLLVPENNKNYDFIKENEIRISKTIIYDI